MKVVYILALLFSFLSLSQQQQANGCHELCGKGRHHSSGSCQEDGSCLCWWGWIGPNAVYMNDGTANHNRVIADHCSEACHYGPHQRNDSCAEVVARKPETKNPSTRKQVPVTEQNHDPKSRDITTKAPFTEHNVEQTMKKNQAKRYTKRGSRVTTKPSDQQQKQTNGCHELCGKGRHHSSGSCQEDGSCLCWWGWIGPNAVYMNDGTANHNRVIADHCSEPCHYGPSQRNDSCAEVSARRLATENPTTKRQVPVTEQSFEEGSKDTTTESQVIKQNFEREPEVYTKRGPRVTAKPSEPTQKAHPAKKHTSNNSNNSNNSERNRVTTQPSHQTVAQYETTKYKRMWNEIS